MVPRATYRYGVAVAKTGKSFRAARKSSAVVDAVVLPAIKIQSQPVRVPHSRHGTVMVAEPAALIPEPGELAVRVVVPEPAALTDAATLVVLFAMLTSAGSARTAVLLLVRATPVVAAALAFPTLGALM